MAGEGAGLGAVFGLVDRAIGAVERGVRSAWGAIANGPLTGVAIAAVLVLTGASIVVGDVARVLDRWVGRLERAAVSAALLAMTGLAFSEYLQRELQPVLQTDLFGLWSGGGQMNMALLLMVIVGFVGASIATQDGKHISVDAADRLLSPGSARFVRRFVALVSAGVAAMLANATWNSIAEMSHDGFEGVKVAGWMVPILNLGIRILPGEKYGPGTQWPEQSDWEDAKFDAGLAFDELPTAFGFVEAGSRLPMWVPLLALTLALAVMAARFVGRAVTAEAPDRPVTAGTRRPADVVLAGGLPGGVIALALGAWLGSGWMIAVASLVLVVLGAPLFVGVAVGTLGCWILLRDGSAETVVTDMFEAVKKQELLSIPFFVLAGNLMTRGSIAERLINIARAALGRVPGGLGVAAVVSCTMFAAISGSSPVTVIAIGSVLYPMLIRDGYGPSYSTGVLATAGSLGIIIPPSVPMIVYAVMVSGAPGVGVLDPAVLFKAGIGPGLFIALVLIVYTLYKNWPRPGVTQARALEVPAIGVSLKRGVASLFLPVLILGGIYGWFDLAPFGVDFAVVFTVPEAAAVSVVYALVVELLLHRELKLKHVPEVLVESATMMGSLFLILVIAISLNKFLVFEQVPEAATAWMLERVDSPFTFILMVNLFLLALGCVMDILSAILIVAPLLAPIAASYGIHPIHFGIMFIVNLEIGYLTPPMGINLFVASTVFERPILEVIRSVLPFLVIMLLCLAVVAWVPGLSLLFVE